MSTAENIKQLNSLVSKIIDNQFHLIHQIENASFPDIPSLIPHMDYNDEIIAKTTQFYMHILITRHIGDMHKMKVDFTDYKKSQYSERIEKAFDTLLELCI